MVVVPVLVRLVGLKTTVTPICKIRTVAVAFVSGDTAIQKNSG
jgi:hypothetical protein